MTRTLARRLVPIAAVALLGAALTAAAPAPRAMFGPPWISIEYPPSPYDRVTRDALLLVHSYHHFTPVGLPVSGTAEGVVDGKRRTVKLQFETTSKPGVYALKRQWSREGSWVLNIAVTQGEGEYNTAGALVTLDAEGKVSKVDVPLRQIAGFEVRTPRRITAAEVEAALQAQVRLASR